MENSAINIEELRDTHVKKRNIFTIFAVCLVILGSVILWNAYIVRETYIKQKNTFVETDMQIVAFNKLSNFKSNVICKYRYKDYEYAFTCYTIKNGEVNTTYKIGDTETIKVNPNNPEEVMTKVNIELYSIIIFIVDIILMSVGIIYSIVCVTKSKNFVKRMEKEANLY